VGETIPAALYGAVAEVLAIIMRRREELRARLEERREGPARRG